jgi:hypothetical protein
VVCVLMMTFRVHLHDAHGDQDGHGHGAELSLGSTLDAGEDAPCDHEDTDPDGCGHCHCAPASVLIAESPAFIFQHQVAGLALLTHPAVVPDSRSYPPDPPPVRLN